MTKRGTWWVFATAAAVATSAVALAAQKGKPSHYCPIDGPHSCRLTAQEADNPARWVRGQRAMDDSLGVWLSLPVRPPGL